MLEFTIYYNDGQRVECLAVGSPRVVELTGGFNSEKSKVLAECDYCVILNNKPIGAFKAATKLNYPDIVFAALKVIDDSITEDKNALLPMMDQLKEIQGGSVN